MAHCEISGRHPQQFPVHHARLHALGAPTQSPKRSPHHRLERDRRRVGVQKRVLSINSIGSMESSNRFIRDVSSFLRKHIDSISPALRPRAATDPLGTMIHLFEKGHPAMPRAPQSVGLPDGRRASPFLGLARIPGNFRRPVRMNSSILGSRDLWSHALRTLVARRRNRRKSSVRRRRPV